MTRRHPNPSALVLLLVLLCAPFAQAIKFALASSRYPAAKCFWHAARNHQLVVVTANVAPNPAGSPQEQRVDLEIVDASDARHVYQSKRNLTGEARFAITTHSDNDVGVCFKNYLDYSVSNSLASSKSRVVDLDVDIGADAVDYNAIANKESLSVLETEMRKIEGIVKEINDELEYLRRRESRFADTNDSTRSRVAYFAWFTIIALVGLGAWQLAHLRAFFKRKYLID